MDSPRRRDTTVDLDASELKAKLNEGREYLPEDPETVTLEIWNDSETFLAVRMRAGRGEYSFRVDSSEVAGDASPFSFDVDFVDLLAHPFENERVRLTFCMPSIRVTPIEEDHRSVVLGRPAPALPNTPFPHRGEYRVGLKGHAKIVRRFLETCDEFGLHEYRMRYHEGVVELYATDLVISVISTLEVDAPPALWDIPVPRAFLDRIVSGAEILADQFHGYGSWFSDGKTFYAHRPENSDGSLDFNMDVPGVLRAIKGFSNRLVVTPDLLGLMKDPRYYLLSATVGCVDLYKLPEDFSYTRPFDFEADELTGQAPYRGDPVSVIVDPRVLRFVCSDRGKAYLTDWPFSPYSVTDGDVHVAVVPPSADPGSVAKASQSLPDVLRLRLESWSGSPEDMSVVAFRGSDSDRQAARAAVFPNPPATEQDALFLAKTPRGFVHAGGVSRTELSTCLFEMTHPVLFSREMVEMLYSGGYWNSLRIYVYDVEFLKSSGADPESPWPDWVTWRLWSGADEEFKRSVSRADGTPRRKRIRPRIKAFTPPTRKVSEKSLENPDGNSGISPINSTGEVSEESDVRYADVIDKADYLIIDSHYVTWRDFHKSGLRNLLHPKTSKPTGIAFGYVRALRQWVKQFQPSKVIAVWDHGVADWRLQMLPGYKDRSDKKSKITDEQLDSMREQRAWIREGLPSMGVHSVRIEGCEADDLISFLAQTYAAKGKVVIVTGDKDFNQLVGENVYVWQDRDKKLLTDPGSASKALFRKVLVGDPSDNIEGVPGFGDKSFDKLVATVEETGKPITLDSLIEAAKDHSDWRVRKLVENREKAEFNLELIDLSEAAIKKLTPQQMMSAVQESERMTGMDPVAFGQWVSALALESISSNVSGWHFDFSTLR